MDAPAQAPNARGSRHAAHRVDFAEFCTRSAREIVPIAWSRGLLFLFDYRGPSLAIDIGEDLLQAALSRLSHAALDLLDRGFIFISAQATWADARRADLALSVAGTGHQLDDARVDAVLRALQLDDKPPLPDAAEGSRAATGLCPYTAAAVSFAANRGDGVLFALDLTLAASPLDSAEPPDAQGARAWLVSDRPGTYQALNRRLQRLGWATACFSSPREAIDSLRLMKPGMARPALVVGAESTLVSADSLRMLRALLPAQTQIVLGTASQAPGGTGDDDDHDDDVQHLVWPFSPAELADITRRPHAAVEPVSGETRPAPLGFRDRPHALVVDDNSVNLLVAGGLLQLAGFEVHTVGAGEDAIAHCRTQAPQLVLMDVHMPGMDGLQTTRQLRRMQRDGALPHFFIVAATADAVEIGQAACHEAGMDGYLSKPLSLASLQHEIDRLLPSLSLPTTSASR